MLPPTVFVGGGPGGPDHLNGFRDDCLFLLLGFEESLLFQGVGQANAAFFRLAFGEGARLGFSLESRQGFLEASVELGGLSLVIFGQPLLLSLQLGFQLSLTAKVFLLPKAELLSFSFGLFARPLFGEGAFPLRGEPTGCLSLFEGRLLPGEPQCLSFTFLGQQGLSFFGFERGDLRGLLGLQFAQPLLFNVAITKEPSGSEEDKDN